MNTLDAGAKSPFSPAVAFSLIEVVAAIGILAAAAVAMLGLLASQSRQAGEMDDSDVAARLGGGIQEELERLKAGLGLDGLAALIPPAGSADPLQLVATRDGRRVLRADGAGSPAGRPLNDPMLPGIALRDRYFLAEASRQMDLPYTADSGFLAVTLRVSWPHRLPAGPPTPGAVSPDADPSRMVPVDERNVMIVNFALRP